MRLHCDANRDIATRGLFNRKTVGEEIGARAAVFFRERQPQQPQLAHLTHKIIGKFSAAIHFFGTWFNLLLRELAAGISNCQLLLVEREVHNAMLPSLAY